jgi:hypothetical protein
MLYRLLADTVLLLHLGFILFVVAGGLLVLRRRGVAWLHLPAAAWGALIQFAGWTCPLTPLENRLRALGGQAGYSGGFVEHYLLAVIYPEGLTRGTQLLLGALVLAVTLGVYGFLVWRAARGGPAERARRGSAPGRTARAAGPPAARAPLRGTPAPATARTQS